MTSTLGIGKPKLYIEKKKKGKKFVKHETNATDKNTTETKIKDCVHCDFTQAVLLYAYILASSEPESTLLEKGFFKCSL